MKIRLHEAAFQDLTEGFEFYERQERNLGAYFLDSLFSDIDSLLIYAGVHPIFFKAYFRMLSKRFPFAIYYRINGNDVIVYAVLDCRRNPAWARKHLKRV